MSKFNLSKAFNNLKAGAAKHSPEILTAISITAMASAIAFTVDATPKAIKLIEEKKELENKEKLTVVETVKTCWKPFLPVVVSATVSAACAIGANSVNLKRNAALATAYQLSATALSEYREKVVETIGEKKEQAIKDKIAKDKVDKNPTASNDIIITGNGVTLCYDAQFGKYFESDIETIRSAINSLNARLLSQDYVSLNEFYYELGIKGIAIGDEIGWNVGRDGLVKVDFSSQLSDNGRPCLVLQYHVAPRYEYHKFM